MKIQVVSDLHLEFWEKRKKYNFVTPSANILCILGDLCCVDSEGKEKISVFFAEISPLYKMILWVPGNHEYYRDEPSSTCTIASINRIAKNIVGKFPNIKFLNCETLEYLYRGTLYRFIGCPFWTKIPESHGKLIEGRMNDYESIYIDWSKKLGTARKLNYKYVNYWHDKCLRYIKKEIAKSLLLKKSQKKIKKVKNIVLTHHKPFMGNRKTDVQHAYESNQMTLLNSGLIHFWGYGHTHEKFFGKVGKTILYSMPKGYKRQNTGYKKNHSVNI